MVQDEDVEALTCLGLTVLQARAYLALTSLEKATIKEISKTANIARQDIYRITSDLQKLGIVEKIITTPNEFRAIPMQDGVKILLQRKHEENSAARIKATQLIQRHKERGTNVQPQVQNPQIILIPEKEALTFRLKKAVENSQKSIEVICSWKKFPKGISILARVFEKALIRGVDVRFIIEKPEHLISLPKETQDLMQSSSFSLRTIPNPPAAVLGIYDSKEVLIAASASGNTVESPALWSDNPSLLAPMQEYFEQMWRRASEDQKQREENTL